MQEKYEKYLGADFELLSGIKKSILIILTPGGNNKEVLRLLVRNS